MPLPIFLTSLPFIFRWQDGFVDHSADPAGRTKKGITQRLFDE